MKIYAKTDTGLVRATNQDAYFAGELESGGLFAVVCDGMGGANGGNVASQTAVKLISEYVIQSYTPRMDSLGVERMLKSAIENANLEVFEMAKTSKELEGMGTTAVVVFVKDGTAVIAHVGDSRAYLVNNELTQITKDHSVVQNLLENGQITLEDAKNHPNKNVITRALGAEENVMVDISELTLEENDSLLLCTDGLSGLIDGEEIFKVLKETESQDVPQKLVDSANKAGGTDNITVVILTTDC